MAGGYCILNNVAIAAQYARHTLGLSRVMIFDWDVHHGNGTQAVFDQDPTVLYVSIHRSDSSFYPFGTGSPSFVGTGAGVGKTINIGWTRAGAGDAEYLAAMDSIVLPIAVEFQPDLLLISAGFDAADGDVGECHVTPEGFRALTKKLLQALPCVPVVATLEGGYVRSVLSECVVQVVQALLEGKDANLYMGGSNVDGAAMKSIDATQAALKPYWSCLQI
jgi:histone deacetylase 6